MTEILLSHGYFLQEDAHEMRVMKPYPPLGLLSVSAYLKRAGFEVDLFDSTFETREALVARLEHGPAGILGLYVNLTTRTSVLSLVSRARELGWTVILGGPEPANYPEEYLRAGASVVVEGEGEVTLAEILGLKEVNAAGLQSIDGVAFLDDEGIVQRTGSRTPIKDLDSLPWPDRESIDLEKYVDTWRHHHGSGSVNLITARGCPYRCRWCSHAVFGYTHRRRSPSDCADELRWIVDRYGPDQVWYADDVFTISHKWLFDYHRELQSRELMVPFETISRADRMMKEDVIATLAEMGCWRIWIGSESGSQRILDKMERGVKVEQVQWATEMAQRHGIQVGMFLMWGYEGETFEDIEATVEHVKKSAPDTFLTTVSYPIKGTPYFGEVAEKLDSPEDWSTSTDRDYRVRGRQSPEYYQLADDWLRNAVAASRADAEGSEAGKLALQAARAREALLVLAANG